MVDIFSRWKTGLARSSKAAFGRLAGLFGATEITDGTWDQLEALLIQADLGLETTERRASPSRVNYDPFWKPSCVPAWMPCQHWIGKLTQVSFCWLASTDLARPPARQN
jgi:hypothetical protein